MGITGMNRLTSLQSYKLAKHIEASYTDSKQSDTDFAASSTKLLGFNVTKANVTFLRLDLGIKANTDETVVKRRIDSYKKTVAAKKAQKQLEKTEPEYNSETLRDVLERVESKLDKLLKAWNI